MNSKTNILKTKAFVLVASLILLTFVAIEFHLSSVAFAVEKNASPELIARGKELFNNKESLGTKYACILCHQKEKTLKRSKILQAGEGLPDLINKSLTEKAKGKSLDRNSEEMKALVAYITYEHSK